MGGILYIRAKPSVYRFFVVDLDKIRYLGNHLMEPADPFPIFHHVLFPSHIFLMTDAAAAPFENLKAPRGIEGVGCPTQNGTRRTAHG
jgi:hypothetical protein